MVPDVTLQHAALAELSFERCVNAAHIGVRRTFNNRHQRKAAHRIARSVPGVSAIENQLVLEPKP
jgi:hypothetical protein